MLELIFFFMAVMFFYQALASLSPRGATKTVVKKGNARTAQTLELADRLYGEKKFIAAEKAYLEALKIDHRNLAAYTRLGMIYSAQRNFSDAIECFQIVAQMSPSAGSYHNLGLIYYENKNYVKAIAALEKSIMFEPSAARYVALAKTYQKIANWQKVVAQLEKAVELSPDKKHLWLLADAFRASGNRHKAQEVYKRILELDPTDLKAKRLVGASAV